jgi:hypothetical protein
MIFLLFYFWCLTPLSTIFQLYHAALRRKNKTGWLGIAVHLGIIRATLLRGNTTTNVDENIKKARRSAYGLFSSGFTVRECQYLLE